MLLAWGRQTIGTAVGASAGANEGAYTAATAQRRYDHAYPQCMYAKGNVVSNYPHPGYYYPPPPSTPPPAGSR